MKSSLKGIKAAEELIELIKVGKSDVSGGDFPQITELAQKNKYYDKLQKDLANVENYEKIDHSTKEEDVQRLFLVLSEQQRRNRRTTRWIRFSASIAAAVAVSFFIYQNGSNNHSPKAVEYAVLETPSKSIYATPTLLLSDGSTVDMTLNMEHELLVEGMKIVKSGKNMITYNRSDLPEVIESRPHYNTLITPKMCLFTIELADGTEVTLNANSELRYPTTFSASSRDVYLKGEAYFNVKKSSKPFIVNCSDVKIKVYGTQFNVSANNLSEVNAVLVEGAIGGSFTKNDGEIKEMRIKPNEMLTINVLNERFDVCEVDTEAYTAWMSGYFRCDSEEVRHLLEELSMWYDVDFYFENERNKEIVITGSFDKNAPLDYIINSLQKITNLKFEKKGGDYIIK